MTATVEFWSKLRRLKKFDLLDLKASKIISSFRSLSKEVMCILSFPFLLLSCIFCDDTITQNIIDLFDSLFTIFLLKTKDTNCRVCYELGGVDCREGE